MLEASDIDNFVKVTGLQYNKEYSTSTDLKSLRYGKLMILTDQNEDGANLKGLLINFIHTNWPHLLRLPFLEEFITPVVKAVKGEDQKYFFSFSAFNEWKSNKPDSQTYKIKFYYGLGTCTSNEIKDYFSNLDRHRVVFQYNGPEDDANIIKAFAEDALEQRKEWLVDHMDKCNQRKVLGLQDKCLYTEETRAITFSEFIDWEYVLFANYDNDVRSIPCVVDGFTPGQRKVLHTCMKRNDHRKIKIYQLAGAIAERAAYHHDEHSLLNIIIGMAQDFIDSNNINLLVPFGPFGSRLMGGKHSVDYDECYDLYTVMSSITRLIFHPHDDPLLSYKFDEANRQIEPNCYVPIIPMILVNGSEATGIGWSTKIPNHDPNQLIRCLRQMIAGKVSEMLMPSYKHFRGTIEAIDDAHFNVNGCFSIIEGNKIEIDELPIGTWTIPYKENVLEPLLNCTEQGKPIISEYKEFHTDTTVRFVISFVPGEFEKLEREIGGFRRTFKLCESIDTSNMHAFDKSYFLRRYEKADDILKEFYDLRLEYYVKRQKYLEKKLTAEANKLSYQVRFIKELSDQKLVIENKTHKEIIDELINLGYPADPVDEWKQEIGIKADETKDGDDDDDEEFELKPEQLWSELDKLYQEISTDKKYDYLLGMSMWMLTEEMKIELFKQCDSKIVELNTLKNKSEYDLWLEDLEALEKKLNELKKK